MNFKFFVIKFVLAFLIGCAFSHLFGKFLPLDKTPTPWLLITILLFPASYCVQALFKLPESDEHPSLTDTELRRLRPIIKVKKTRLTLLFIYYILSALTISIFFISVPNSSKLYMKMFTIVLGLISSSIYSFFFIHSTMDEIQKFKSKLIHRTENERLKKEMLKKMTEDDEE
ncbi:hypothetical protein HGT71_05875 [Rosenbergiella epipactidis]|uniref:hypothetical protein n=1 Tax=Rosenbergiella epipactidis TaxID=1544694 RepID=UPI001BD9F112|nr:hypothetical protein [Rosenbergiella epipactidis]MBT0717800.1 hypothetical protein [Rosenbergiella epipactidis]